MNRIARRGLGAVVGATLALTGAIASAGSADAASSRTVYRSCTSGIYRLIVSGTISDAGSGKVKLNLTGTVQARGRGFDPLLPVDITLYFGKYSATAKRKGQLNWTPPAVPGRVSDTAKAKFNGLGGGCTTKSA